MSNDLIDIDRAQNLDEMVEKATYDVLSSQIGKIVKNIGEAAVKASEFMNSAINDPSISPEDKLKVAQYLINHVLGSPTARMKMQVNTKSVSASLNVQTPVEKIGQALSHYKVEQRKDDEETPLLSVDAEFEHIDQ